MKITECSGKENSVLMFFFHNQNINSLPKYDIRAVGHLILLGLKKHKSMTLSGSLDALGTLFIWSVTFDKLKQNLKTISF